MTYIVIVKADMNDADYIEQSNSIADIDSPCFADFEDMEDCKLTYSDVFNNFFPVITELKKELNLTQYDSNWTDKITDLFYDRLSKKLEHISADIPTDYLSELLQDFIPGNYDYPIHDILSIQLIPIIDNSVITLKT